MPNTFTPRNPITTEYPIESPDMALPPGTLCWWIHHGCSIIPLPLELTVAYDDVVWVRPRVEAILQTKPWVEADLRLTAFRPVQNLDRIPDELKGLPHSTAEDRDEFRRRVFRYRNTIMELMVEECPDIPYRTVKTLDPPRDIITLDFPDPQIYMDMLVAEDWPPRSNCNMETELAYMRYLDLLGKEAVAERQKALAGQQG